MLLAIEVDRLLHTMNDVIFGRMIEKGKRVQGDMPVGMYICDLERLVQVTFWNVTEVRNVRYGHPGANSANITGGDRGVLCLQSLEILYGGHGSNNCRAYR